MSFRYPGTWIETNNIHKLSMISTIRVMLRYAARLRILKSENRCVNSKKQIERLENVIQMMTMKAGLMDTARRITDRVRGFAPNIKSKFFSMLNQSTRKIGLPTEELVWRDPVKLQRVLDGLSQDDLKKALEVTDRFLGLAAYED